MSNYFTYTCRTAKQFEQAMDDYGWIVYQDAVSPSLIDQIKHDMDEGYKLRRAIQQKNGISADMSGTLHHLLEKDNFSLPFLSKMFCDDEIKSFLGGKYILNGINGVIHSKHESPYLSNMHRDIRTFMPDTHILLQMIVVVDDFTAQNGATHFLSGSHKRDLRPDESYFYKHADRAVTSKGSIILFNANLWHAAGENRTTQPRRALTLGFTRPFIKQQMDYSRFLGYNLVGSLEPALRQVIGYNARVPENLNEYYQPPHLRMYQRDQG